MVMNNKLNRTMAAAAFLLMAGAASAQDIHFSQFYMSPLVQNPALAGANFDLQAVLNYKDQWKAVASPYRTIGASYDMRFGKKEPKSGYFGGGLLFFSDKAGDANMGTMNVSLPLAYHVFLGANSKLSAGVQPSYCQRSMNFANLQWGNQYVAGSFNANNPSGEPVSGSASLSFFDAGAGILWSYHKGEMYISAHNQLNVNLGFSVFHITQPKYSFYSTASETLYRKYVLYGNSAIGIKNTSLALVPGFIFYRQGSAQEILAGASFRYLLKENSKYTSFVNGSALSVGAYYRAKDAIAATVLLELGNYAIGFSYDVNTSDLKAASNYKGGFEVSLRFVNPNPFLEKSSVSRIH
jgi:type IX secretion system PorP/SprF family membrane protein